MAGPDNDFALLRISHDSLPICQLCACTSYTCAILTLPTIVLSVLPRRQARWAWTPWCCTAPRSSMSGTRRWRGSGPAGRRRSTSGSARCWAATWRRARSCWQRRARELGHLLQCIFCVYFADATVEPCIAYRHASADTCVSRHCVPLGRPTPHWHCATQRLNDMQLLYHLSLNRASLCRLTPRWRCATDWHTAPSTYHLSFYRASLCRSTPRWRCATRWPPCTPALRHTAPRWARAARRWWASASS